MKIISKRELVECVAYSHSFEWRDKPGAGFSFPCDKDGKLDGLNPCAQENLDKCLSGEYDVVDHGIEQHEWTYREPAVGVCEECGEEVALAHFTNTCECGADYNSSGQRLAPRSQWGEETGEAWYECY